MSPRPKRMALPVSKPKPPAGKRHSNHAPQRGAAATSTSRHQRRAEEAKARAERGNEVEKDGRL
jgi:hypothetical protein